MNELQSSAAIDKYAASCTNCVLPGLCLRSGMPPEDVERLDRLVYTRRNVKQGKDLYRAGDPFSAIYAIRSGFFKSELVLQDGRSQIMGFHMPGEVLGMDGINAGAFACNAVALEDAEVCVIPLSRFEEISHGFFGVAHLLHQIMSREIVREQRMMALLGSNAAEARLAAFLVDLAERFSARGEATSDLKLPMIRKDIGSFLGLKLETVSRLFSKLRDEKLIEVRKKRIRILDMAGLKQLL